MDVVHVDRSVPPLGAGVRTEAVDGKVKVGQLDSPLRGGRAKTKRYTPLPKHLVRDKKIGAKPFIMC